MGELSFEINRGMQPTNQTELVRVIVNKNIIEVPPDEAWEYKSGAMRYVPPSTDEQEGDKS